MRQFRTIAINAFMELVRQPVFLLLTTCASAFIIFLAAVPYFGFGDDPKLVKDGSLAVMLVCGLVAAVLSASSSVAMEIRTGTALAVLAKPVSRVQFLLAKYLGLAAALTVMTYVNAIAALLASRMAFDAYGDADLAGTSVYYAALALAFLLGGLTNYFLRRPFVADAMRFLVVLSTIAFFVIVHAVKLNRPGLGDPMVDYRLVPASVLVLFALWILAGLALACSTRYEVVPTLAICTALFLLGLMSDYLFGTLAESKSAWRLAGEVLYAAVPNWQLFWITDAIEGTKAIEGVWIYVVKAFGYVVCYLGASLALALALFQDRELGGTQ
jgi:ABC-type transport system involved in multi-copper enzyme maturation permease subunit